MRQHDTPISAVRYGLRIFLSHDTHQCMQLPGLHKLQTTSKFQDADSGRRCPSQWSSTRVHLPATYLTSPAYSMSIQRPMSQYDNCGAHRSARPPRILSHSTNVSRLVKDYMRKAEIHCNSMERLLPMEKLLPIWYRRVQHRTKIQHGIACCRQIVRS